MKNLRALYSKEIGRGEVFTHSYEIPITCGMFAGAIAKLSYIKVPNRTSVVYGGLPPYPTTFTYHSLSIPNTPDMFILHDLYEHSLDDVRPSILVSIDNYSFHEYVLYAGSIISIEEWLCLPERIEYVVKQELKNG